MRIVIDMQGAQTASRFRGIGRYSMAFARAVIINRQEHEVFLVLNGLFTETIEFIRAAFDDLLPQSNILVWHAPGPLCAIHPENAARHAVAALIRENFLAKLQPDLIHISSLFEGYVDDAVISLRRLDMKTPLSVSFYDLIPYLNPAQYLDPHPLYASYYLSCIHQLQQASVCLAISDFSRQEAIENLPDLSDRVVAVSTAVDAHFRVTDLVDDEVRALLRRFGIRDSFVLYTGGADERKNLPRLLQAYAGLPFSLRQQHQLVFAGKLTAEVITFLSQHARKVGLQEHELLFTGFVTDEQLVQLYNLCRLFVFPSWQEGFGLPALEAMACGAVVIGANTSSLPEVIGWPDAMFDPRDVRAITDKMQLALTDPGFRDSLRKHGLEQATRFSWDAVATRALAAWEDVHARHCKSADSIAVPKSRLAYVSPLPPQRSGIADYSAALLPVLARYYDIDLIQEYAAPDMPFDGVKFQVKDAHWLRDHAASYDRVIYQMGNSPFHAYMLTLIKEVPGTLVLHDFYLSGLFSWLEKQAGHEQAWVDALYESHGYSAVRHRLDNAHEAYLEYPVNWGVLQHARGVIVHSHHSLQLMKQWYDSIAPQAVDAIPLLRASVPVGSRATARQKLGWSQDDFVVCSFGFLDASKLNHELLQCWLSSELSSHAHGRLIFVGENEGGKYGSDLLYAIEQSGRRAQVNITGFVDAQEYAAYLMAADVAVQLRTLSRGETSAAALDCMNHGLPMIVNACGSMAELESDAVWMLPEKFDPAQLILALETLYRDPARRQFMGVLAKDIISTRHNPLACASQYVQSIEKFYRQDNSFASVLLPALCQALPLDAADEDMFRLTQALARDFPTPQPARTLYLDITATCAHDRKTGIERVARSLVLAYLQSPPPGWRAEPVYLCNATGQWLHRKARRYSLSLLGCPMDDASDDVVEPQNADLMLVLDLSGDRLVQAQQAGLFDLYRRQGAQVHALVYDLLPVNMPEVFPPGADLAHARWLTSVSRLDGAICISRAVCSELAAWQLQQGLAWAGRKSFHRGYFHLGSDLDQSAPSAGMPNDAECLLGLVRSRPTFLMVGTIEPRKNHAQVLDAFSLLWAQGIDVNLVIVGQEGWRGLEPSQRRNIPQVVHRLLQHPELGRRLFWPEDVSDEFLTHVYASCTCLLVPSWGEGFGLPLVEAARHRLPVLARDLPVFREIAVDGIRYFNAKDPEGLALAVQDWLKQPVERAELTAVQAAVLTWAQSVAQINEVLWPTSAQ